MKILLENSRVIAILSLLLSACSSGDAPKPLAYFRIALEPKQYALSDSCRPYVFEYPSNVARIVYGSNQDWFDIVYPAYNARIYCSYKPGNAASQVQFVITDSVRHCLRGALYFNERPNKDSIAPVADYIREDIIRLMETARWK